MTTQYPIQQAERERGGSAGGQQVDPYYSQPGGGGGAGGLPFWDAIAGKPKSFPTSARDLILQLKDLTRRKLWVVEDFVINAVNTAPDGWTRSVGGDGASTGRGTNVDGVWGCETAAGGGSGMGSIIYGSGAAQNPCRVDEKPLAVFRFQQRAADADGAFTWIGIGDTSAFTTNSSVDFNDFIGFRYKNAAGVRTLEAVTRDDTIETATNLNLAVVVGRWYRLEVEMITTTSVVLSVFDEAATGGASPIKVAHTANLPDAGAFLTIGMKHFGDGGAAALDYAMMFQDRTAGTAS